MRVLLVSHLWPRTDLMHLGVFVAEQVAELAKKVDISVVVPDDTTLRRNELSLHELVTGFPKRHRRLTAELAETGNIKPKVITFKGPFFKNRYPEKTAKAFCTALESIDTDNYDLVHAHTIFPDGLGCAYWLGNRKIPLIVTGHGSDVHSISPGVSRVIKPLFDRSEKLIPVSSFLADKLIALGANPDKIQTIPNGFSDVSFGEIDAEKSRIPGAIAFLGRLDPIKRVDLLIKAVALCRRDVSLDIAGDGSMRNELESMVEKLGLTDRVRFHGRIERSEIPQFLSRSQLMCLVSRIEGWPTVIFEALASGTPVLGTAVGGIPEALEDRKLGVTVPANISTQDLAKEIEAAIDNNWDRHYMIQVAKKHSWDRITDRIISLYEEII